ncbi:MAG: hypothetical protein D6784_12305 [Chloroflexi bacterium]|nr:MAG: hypothetical protein D6784_12305 [Chloroflexota bacterium]
MHPEHVTHLLDAYLDKQLPVQDSRAVEAHLLLCPDCRREFQKAQRLTEEIGPTLKAVLGYPAPPDSLRRQLRQQIEQQSGTFLRWPVWSRPVANAAGIGIAIAVLSAAVLLAVRSQTSTPLTLSTLETASGGDVSTAVESTVLPTPAPTRKALSSLGDTLPPLDTLPDGTATVTGGKYDTAGDSAPTPKPAPPAPQGLIAFAVYNPAPDRQVYEIHLLNANGTNHRRFPLDGVSEPALKFTPEGHQLAFRAWGQPTAPRALQTSNLSGELPRMVGGFWEDAHPDWSPTENRLIFASQRESDRRWRLYTIWADGSAEKDLRREGRSPSFAPDGYHFVFVGCDRTGSPCGLWQSNLDYSETEATLILDDPQAAAPDWSPVDSRIAFMSVQDGNWDLYLVEADGSHLRRLTYDQAVDGLPAWSPDGEWLAFLSNRGNTWGIWSLHVDSGALKQLYRFAGVSPVPPPGDPYGERSWQDEQLSWSR